LLLLAGVGGSLLLGFAASVLTAFRGTPASVAWDRVSSDPVNLAFSQIAGVTIALLIGKRLFLHPYEWSAVLRLRPVGFPLLALSFVTGCALQFPLAEISNIAAEFFPPSNEHQEWLKQLVSPAHWRQALAGFFCIVVVPPWTEELLFRGLFFTGLRLRYGFISTLLVTSIVFGISHGAPYAMLPAIVAGVIFGCTAWRAHSTIPSILMHTGVNAMPLLLPSTLVKIPGFNVDSPGPVHLSAPLLIGASAFFALTFALLFRYAKYDVPPAA